MERYVGKRVVDAVIAGPKADISGIDDRLVIQTPLEASDVPYRHDRALLRGAGESDPAAGLILRAEAALFGAP